VATLKNVVDDVGADKGVLVSTAGLLSKVEAIVAQRDDHLEE
jgi:hypothetical protein